MRWCMTRLLLAAGAAAKLAEEIGTRQLVIVTSDFARAFETADVVRQKLRVPDKNFVVKTALRERNFGKWEGTTNANYERVWADDKVNADHQVKGVESVNAVVDRTTRLVVELDKQYSNTVIVLVAHGDVLQILNTAFERIDPRRHRSLPHMGNCAVVPYRLKQTESLAE
eukprot:TRINITY_DN61112_c0_g1_i2.p1 TRINITY_DN61112_c0_g1~~TRINITY_DN61112_c0_g1_i2.p1  ORF type:complete len:170 (-),score=62.58 TRINITY_DN61112_c0_g1_i2:463-972(-)